jgi:eukaryotic-like serine/threonine-protein kinase
MASSETCPVCATPLPQDAPQGYCPRCLAGLAAGLAPKLIEDHPSQIAHGRDQTVRQFGDYELMAEVASGGMGVVYRARQISLNRIVALKMIRAGQFASPAEVQRFRTEAEAAANLDHPNIVPIYEVGEHEGRHYFSMKLVEGGSLAERISNLNFPVPNREGARLIATLSRAVHHAHQRGVLHRDIKPTNILLDQNGEPHLTDFGLAKLVESGGDLTQTLAILGTPHYMAPEQAAGRAREVTTAADIYSLGAVLYELLAGRPPFPSESALQVLQHAQHREPESLRKLKPAIDRDLETICLKCLEKEPAHRYGTAESLAEDLDHWLAGEPIQARPVSAPERVFKWTRRNPAIATLIGLAHVLFLAGLVGVLWQWWRAEQSARRAEANESQAAAEAIKSREVAQFLKEMLAGVGPSVALGRDTTMLREILDKTVERLDQDLKNQPAVEAELRFTLGQVYLGLGEFRESEAMHRKALAIRRKQFGDEHIEVVASLNQLAEVLHEQMRFGESEALYRQALRVGRQLWGDEHLTVADSLCGLAYALYNLERHDESENLHREALRIRRKHLGEENAGVAESLHNLAVAIRASPRHMVVSPERLEEAQNLNRQALAIRRKLFGEEHPLVADSLNTLAAGMRLQGNLPEAERLHREALAIRRKLLSPEHFRLTWTLQYLSYVLGDQGRLEEAEDTVREALRITRKTLGDEHEATANRLSDLATVVWQRGELAEAESALQEALAIRRKLLPVNDPKLATALDRLAMLHLERQKFAEAELLARECLTIREQSIPGDWLTFHARSLLGGSLLGQRKYVEAEPLLLSGYEGLKEREDKMRADVRALRLKQSLQRLAELYEATAQPDQAAEWQRRLAEFDPVGLATKP